MNKVTSHEAAKGLLTSELYVHHTLTSVSWAVRLVVVRLKIYINKEVAVVSSTFPEELGFKEI